MRRRTRFLPVALSAVIALPTCAAIPDCHSSIDLLYCQEPAALMRVMPFWSWMFTPSAGGHGATPQNLQVIYASSCWQMPAGTHVRVVDERKFRGRDDTYSLARVAFDEPRSHMEDRYTAEGEYTGQVKVTYSRGWTFKKELKCD